MKDENKSQQADTNSRRWTTNGRLGVSTNTADDNKWQQQQGLGSAGKGQEQELVGRHKQQMTDDNWQATSSSSSSSSNGGMVAEALWSGSVMQKAGNDMDWDAKQDKIKQPI